MSRQGNEDRLDAMCKAISVLEESKTDLARGLEQLGVFKTLRGAAELSHANVSDVYDTIEEILDEFVPLLKDVGKELAEVREQTKFVMDYLVEKKGVKYKSLRDNKKDEDCDDE